MTPAPYDQDADQTPPHGIERPAACPHGCDILHLAGDQPWFACRATRPEMCPMGGVA